MNNENTFKEKLDQIQYSMAEIVFRPVRVVRTCWRKGRPATGVYNLAIWTLFIPWLGFGAAMAWAMRGDDAFRLDAGPSLAFSVAEWFIVIWVISLLYLLAMSMIIQFIGWFRKDQV